MSMRKGTIRKTYMAPANAVVGRGSSVTTTRSLADSRKQLETAYKRDTEAYLQLQKEKEHKKRLEKLKRYEGVGLLGNKLSGGPSMTEEEAGTSLWYAREEAQMSYDDQKISKLKEKDEEDRLKLEKEQKKRLEKLERYKGVGLPGNKLSGGPSLTEEESGSSLWYAREEAQMSYDHQKICKLKQKDEEDRIKLEEERKKRLEKLDRYKGIGLVGEKLGNPSSLKEKKMSLESARQELQKAYDAQRMSKNENKIKEEQNDLLKKESDKLKQGNTLVDSSSNSNKVKKSPLPAQSQIIRNSINSSTDESDEKKKLELVELEKEQMKRLEELKRSNAAKEVSSRNIVEYPLPLGRKYDLKNDTVQHSHVVIKEEDLYRPQRTFENKINLNELSEPLEISNTGGHVLGGKKYEKGKGDHPLLASLK